MSYHNNINSDIEEDKVIEMIRKTGCLEYHYGLQVSYNIAFSFPL